MSPAAAALGLLLTSLPAAPRGQGVEPTWAATDLVVSGAHPEEARLLRATWARHRPLHASLPGPWRIEVTGAPTADGLPDEEDPVVLDPEGAPILRLRPVAQDPELRGDDGPLIRARSLVAALVWYLDAQRGWSESRGWRAFARWRGPLSTPLTWSTTADNVHHEAFLDARAARSPRWELATLAARLLEPGAAPTSGDDSLACRRIAQVRLVRRALAEVAPLPAPEPERCDAFERWANLDRLVDLELILAAPSTGMAASLFGHLGMRAVYEDEHGARPLHRSRSFAFLAESDGPVETDPLYVVKGITGGFLARLHEEPFLETYRSYVIREGRDLRRWRMRLTAEERREVMERIWSVRRFGAYRYYFFTDNCASLLVELLDGALQSDEPIRVAHRLLAGPSMALEGVAHARATDGGPLLDFVPESFTSPGQDAQRASEVRATLERAWLDSVRDQLGAEEFTGARADLAAARATDPATRAQAYERLGERMAAAGDGAVAYAYLRQSARIETHLSLVHNLQQEEDRERARRQAIEAELAALQAEAAAAAPPKVAWAAHGGSGVARAALAAQIDGIYESLASSRREGRLDGYRAAAALVADLRADPSWVERLRWTSVLVAELRFDFQALRRHDLYRTLARPDGARPVDGQSFVRDAALLRYPFTTEVSAPLLAAQRAKGRLVARRGLVVDPVALAAEERAVRAEARRQGHERSGMESGLGGLRLLGAADASAPHRSGLVLGGTVFEQRLGDRRRHGFPGDTELVVARTLVRWSAPRGQPFVSESRTRWIGYRTARPSLPQTAGLLHPFGWEGYLDTQSSRARGIAVRGKGAVGAVLALWQRDELADHLLLSVGPTYELTIPRPSQGPARPWLHHVGIDAGLEVRYSLWPQHTYDHALRVGAFLQPAFDLRALDWVWRWRLEGEVGVRLVEELDLGLWRDLEVAALVQARYVHDPVRFTGSPIDEVEVSAGLALR